MSSIDPEESGEGSLIGLAALSLLTGILSGTLVALFRLALDYGNNLRNSFLFDAKNMDFGGLLLAMVLAGASSAIATGLVRRFAPEASGSGIPHVEAVLAGELRPASPFLIPIKFIGGWLAMSAGLALGREGPSVQMGASISLVISRIFHLCPADMRSLIAGGAGAGLATAFNAPAAGAIFVIEELTGKFEARRAVVALGASVGAITTSRMMVGANPDLIAESVTANGAGSQLAFLLLGLLCGVVAIAYNRSLLATLSFWGRFNWPIEVKAGLIGASVGALGWLWPDSIGSGDSISQAALTSQLSIGTLAAFLILRFLLGSLSYAAATPGGLFAPMLALGAIIGSLFALSAITMFSDLTLQPEAYVIVGMASLFAGVVRAPLTGLVLIIEMTGTSSLLLPLLMGCFGAMLPPIVVGDLPIYAALRERTAQSKR